MIRSFLSWVIKKIGITYVEHDTLSKLEVTLPVHPRTPRTPIAEGATAVQLDRKESFSSMPSIGETLTDSSISDHAAPEFDDLPNLEVTYPVHSRTAQVRNADDTAVVQLQQMTSALSLETLSDAPAVKSSASTQTDNTKESAMNRYGALVASSLSAILGAILAIVSKTHGHDEIEVEGADDLQPEVPNYDAIGQQAAQDAEQAFIDKWHDPELWGPGKVDGDGRNIETGEKNPYFEAVRDQETGEA